MKNRRKIIVAFLVLATLVMGVGYAAVNGTLKISGAAEFNGTSIVQSDVNKALKFESAAVVDGYANVCTAGVTTDHAADMSVTFNDGIGNPGDVFTAMAKFTIKYDTTDTTLPAVTLTLPVAEIPSQAGSPGWDIETDWSADRSLNPGESTTITVTVTYTNQNPAEENSVSATINVPIPFATVSTGSASN